MNSSLGDRARRQALAGVSLVAVLAAAGAAQAQEAAPADLEGVVVTASRIVRDGYEAPTPTTVIGSAEIAKQAPANIADFVNKLPQLGSAGSPRTTTANAGSGTGGANFLNTRNLGPNRTLVLLDGKRVVGSRLTGAVDVNMLPTALVSRVDVVTGGASAAWGSDAVAGVVNFVLDTRFTGLKGTAAYGQSFLGDADSFNADLSFGAPFAGGRGHVILSGRLQTGDPVDEIASRDWFTGYKAIPNINRTATNGQPGFLAVDNAGLGRATDGSVIVSGPLAGTQFFADGTFGPYRLATQGSGILGAGGDVQDVAGRFALLPWLRQKGVFGRVSYDLTDDVNVYGELSWSRSNTLNHSTPYVRHGDITIRADNAFIPAGLNLQGLTQFQIGRTNFDLDMTHSRNIRELTRWVAGVDGKMDWFDSSFRWNAYYQHGTSEIYNEISNNPIRANFDRAFDSVRNPAVGGVPGVAVGAPVCRSTLTDPANGCVAFNWVGYGSPSQAAIDYVNGVAWQQVTMKQDVAAAGFQFEPFSTWAGAVSLAAGYEWRKEQYKNTTDPLSPTAGTPYWFGNYKLGAGSYTVNEGFGELIVPVVRDAPLIKSLDLNGAVRVTKYSTTGRVTTWKVGGTWDVNDELRLRATKSRDIRAPNLFDLFLGAQCSGGGVVEPGGAAQVFVTTCAGGNPNLQPEIADTTAFGAVYRPAWLSGFSMSVDYYSINIDDAIVTQNAQTIVNQCYGVGGPAIPSVCSAIEAPFSGTLREAIIRTGGVNVASLNTNGVDIEVGYRRNLEDLNADWRGSVDLRAVGAYVAKFESTTAGILTNNLGMHVSSEAQFGGALKWRWLVTGTYNLGPSSTTLTARYIGPGVFSNWAPDDVRAIDKNDIDSVTYFDLTQTWSTEIAGAKVQFFGVIENLFDADPPKIPNAEGAAYADAGTSPLYFDLIGRSWRLGFRFQY